MHNNHWDIIPLCMPLPCFDSICCVCMAVRRHHACTRAARLTVNCREQVASWRAEVLKQDYRCQTCWR